MQKVRLPQQADIDETIQTFASSPCGMNNGDPVYSGFWSKEAVLNFLKKLLESERIGVKAFAAIGRAADLHVADTWFLSLNWPKGRSASYSKRRLLCVGELMPDAAKAQPPCLV